MIKRFLVFKGTTYYPGGGWSDYIESYDSIEKAKEIAKSLHDSDDWSEIVDVTIEKAIMHYYFRPQKQQNGKVDFILIEEELNV